MAFKQHSPRRLGMMTIEESPAFMLHIYMQTLRDAYWLVESCKQLSFSLTFCTPMRCAQV